MEGVQEVVTHATAGGQPRSRGASRGAAPRGSRNNPYATSPRGAAVSGGQCGTAGGYGAYAGASLTENPEDTTEITSLFPTFEPDAGLVGPGTHPHHHSTSHGASFHGQLPRAPSLGMSSGSKLTTTTHNPYGVAHVLASSQGQAYAPAGAPNGSTHAMPSCAGGHGGVAADHSASGQLFAPDAAAYAYPPGMSGAGGSRSFAPASGAADSNGTSQNPLMFHFGASHAESSTSYGDDGSPFKDRVRGGAVSGHGCPPQSSQGNVHGAGSSAMGTSLGDVRFVTTEIHETANLTVSVKQRVRTGALTPGGSTAGPPPDRTCPSPHDAPATGQQSYYPPQHSYPHVYQYPPHPQHQQQQQRPASWGYHDPGAYGYGPAHPPMAAYGAHGEGPSPAPSGASDMYMGSHTPSPHWGTTQGAGGYAHGAVYQHQHQQHQQQQQHEQQQQQPHTPQQQPRRRSPPSAPSHGSRSRGASHGRRTPCARSEARGSRPTTPGRSHRRSPAGASLHGRSRSRSRGRSSSPSSLRSKQAGGKRRKGKLRGSQDDTYLRADRSQPVTGFVNVAGKREGFRYATSLDLEKDLPIGTHVLVEGDRGELMGVVVRHVTIEEMVRDCERLRIIAPHLGKSAAAQAQDGGAAPSATAARKGRRRTASQNSSVLFDSSEVSSTAAPPPPGGVDKEGTQVYKPVSPTTSEPGKGGAKAHAHPAGAVSQPVTAAAAAAEEAKAVDAAGSNEAGQDGKGNPPASTDTAAAAAALRAKLETVVFAYRDWPWVVQVASAEAAALLQEQRQLEEKAFTTASNIVRHYLWRSSGEEEGSGATAGAQAKDGEAAAMTGAKGGAVKSRAARASDSDEDVGAERGEGAGGAAPNGIHLVDVEYQLGRRKLTLYVSRPSPEIFVDFRRMQRKLYRAFQCRIWMAYMDEIGTDNDNPEQVERLVKMHAQKQEQQRRAKEAREPASAAAAAPRAVQAS